MKVEGTIAKETHKMKIFNGMVEEILPTLEANSFDACLCDPPYLLEFMGKEFDKQHKKMSGANEGQKMQAWHEEWCNAVYRVLKPGAHMLAFGGTRTYHRLVCAAEDVGFEVRDMLAWMHGQGFPKSKSQLKPAHEPILLARKPGASGYLSLDSCRIAGTVPATTQGQSTQTKEFIPSPCGRWPANLILSHHPDCSHVSKGKGVAKTPTADADGMETIEVWECHPDCPVRMLDEQSGVLKSPKSYRRNAPGGVNKHTFSASETEPIGTISNNYGDQGGASRFFYCAKVSTRERNLGGTDCRHPTLKPISLTTYLATLLLTPSPYPRRILIPFSGAGSEMIGALRAGWEEVVGIEMDEESISWSYSRIKCYDSFTDDDITLSSDKQKSSSTLGSKPIKHKVISTSLDIDDI